MQTKQTNELTTKQIRTVRKLNHKINADKSDKKTRFGQPRSNEK